MSIGHRSSLVSLVKILIAVFVLLTAVAYTTLLERKVVAHMQNRWGPREWARSASGSRWRTA